MRLVEFYSADEDNSIVRRPQDTRKTMITLNHLNKLRKLRDFNRAEEARYNQFARRMYGNAPDDEQGGGMI